ncbi:MAG: gfo/Idh/MocA family oxidoreductase [Verrucomicrobia bacterium]|nr:gfo/Idh/MocA family oxidoreductase [Verrucomicrobiota bacterium]
MKTLRLGLIGLDTSHVEGFAALINDARNPDHVPGGQIVAGFPGGSPDFPLSINRVDGYTQKLRDSYQVKMLSSPREVAAAVDAVLHTTVDGRIHLAQFAEIAPLRRPTFLDKPFATTSADARAIAELAQRHGTPLFSSSSLRYAGAFTAALADQSGGKVTGADFFGPLHLQPSQPGFFWYGIHTAEMLYATLGTGCASVRVSATSDHEVATGTWRDGRLGVIRGYRTSNNSFGGVIHREKTTHYVDVAAGPRPDVGLTQAIMRFFHGAPAPVALEETVELIRFLEAANESRANGGREVEL